MKKFIRNIIFALTLSASGLPEVHAVRSIDSQADFDGIINNDMVFAHIYFKGKAENRDAEFKAGYNFTSDLFAELQKEYAHIVTFVKVNAEREHLTGIGEHYTGGTYPMFCLFRFGEKQAQIHIPYSRMSKKKLMDFLHDNFGKLIKKKARRLEKEAEERRESSSVGISFNFGYSVYDPYYPYGYYPYGYYGNYYPYGWSYPGRGYYYAPVRRRSRYRRVRGYRK